VTAGRLPDPVALRLLRLLARLVAGLALALLLTAAAVAAHAFWLAHWAGPPRPAAVIVVLGGGVFPDGRPGPDSLARARQGIALYEAGVAPRLHFTGGHRNPDLPGLGDGMAAVALVAGVPAEAISTENASRSTLQNALLSREVLPPGEAGTVLLVSDGYHLARAWASFRWAGYRPVRLAAATAFGGGTAMAQLRRVSREPLAWVFNVARLAVWVGMNAVGLERPDTSDLLAAVPPARVPA
jgi:uncharacterized SAM-binding protein YcdF (DUF218 family)